MFGSCYAGTDIYVPAIGVVDGVKD
jgi:hypothetical protein